jgi:influenza virus NS1A-binding protein
MPNVLVVSDCVGRDVGDEDNKSNQKISRKPKINGHGDMHSNETDEEEDVISELLLIPQRTRNAVSRRDDETDQWGAEELAAKEEHMLILHDRSLKETLMSRVNTFRRNRELCDVVFFVNEREILAHKIVLASISPALFDRFLNEADTGTSKDRNKLIPSPSPSPTIIAGASTKQLSYYEFAQADYECFEALVNYAYTSKLQISSRRVADLYKTAYALQVFPVAKACARYLADHLSCANCVGVRRQANFNNDKYLVDKVDSFLAENIERISSDSTEFTQLPCIKVRIIGHFDSLREDTGYPLAEKLLLYFRKYQRVSDRAEQQIDALTDKTHLLYLEEDLADLQDCADMDDRSSVGSCDVVQDYKRSGTSKTVGHHSVPLGVLPVQHHVTGATSVKINASLVNSAKFASTDSLNSLASTATDTDEEIEFKLIAVTPNSPGFWIALTVLFRRLVVFSIQTTENEDIIRPRQRESSSNSESGSVTSAPHEETNDSANGTKSNHENAVSNGGAETAKAHQETTQKSLLTKLPGRNAYPRVLLPQMEIARCSVGAVFVNGKIIICGGYDRGECLKSVEEYDVIKGEWRSLPNMTSERGRFDAAVVNGKVYAVAGSNGNNDLRSAECFDPKTKTWTPIKPLHKARSHNGCAALDDMIYCIGGSSDQTALRDCERYDPKTDEWQRIAPMHTARFQAGCVAWKGLVVSCAGCDRWTCLDTVEAYDPNANAWRFLDKLKIPRRGCAVAVIRDSLYVVGGHDGTQSLSSVEVLDHPNGRWRLGPQLTVPRANTHAVVTAGNMAYVIGGFNGNQFLSSIEILENEGLGWRNWQQKFNNDSSIAEDEEEEGDGNDVSSSESDTPRPPTAINVE